MELTNQKYRVSEVGMIPYEWDVKELGDIAYVIGGGTPSTFNVDYWNGDINWFTPTEIGLKKYSYERRS
jgi:type I restriction enzyme S subunit